mgnify:CR=1 FL=1
MSTGTEFFNPFILLSSKLLSVNGFVLSPLIYCLLDPLKTTLAVLGLNCPPSKIKSPTIFQI